MLVVAVTLAGCFLAPAPAPSLAPATTGVDAALLPFYAQTLQWTPCESGEFDCTTVRAPRNWADPAAGDIELSVIRHRATSGEPIGSLLTNPGGPGASGYDHVRYAVGGAYSETVQESYDIVGFDPRGVGRSAPVSCLDPAGMDEFLYGVPDAERGTAEWQAERTAMSQVFVDACEENSGDLLPFISTEDAARDLDLLRGVLGDESLNYIGYSWGTALGTAYARLFPQNVGRMVLDGAMDPSISVVETGATQAVGFEASLRAFFADCATRDDCPYRGTVDDMMNDLGALLARVDQRPLKGGDGRELGADTLMTAIIMTLYSQGSWPALRMVLTEVEGSVTATAFSAADSYNRRGGGDYPGNQTEAFSAYNCRDYPPVPVDVQQATEDAVLREAPVTGPYWFGADVCALWPAASTAVRGPVAADGAAPILVIGTTGDPATPYEWAESLAAQLSSGVLVTRVGEGHTGYRQGNPCVDGVVDDYLLDGVVPDSDVRCE
jgi:pimeloyl-ACP methyl ester carboxylesterase